MKKLFTILIILCASLFFIFPINQLNAKKKGKTGMTNANTKSCGECHDKFPNSNVKVTLSSSTGTFEVEPNSKTKFIMTIQTLNGITAGCNIAVKTNINGTISAGTFQTISNFLQISNGEITHTQPTTITNGTTSFEFYWTAPSLPGNYYLQAVGLASNNNNKDDAGDIWNFATVQTIIVKSPNSIQSEYISKPFEFYPYPITSNSKLIINNLAKFSKINKITIINNAGQAVSITDVDNLMNSLNNLSSGYYLLYFQIDGAAHTEKIVKIN